MVHNKHATAVDLIIHPRTIFGTITFTRQPQGVLETNNGVDLNACEADDIR